METLTITMAIAILGVVLNVFNFYYTRKKETITNVKELDKESTNQQLIDYRLTKVEEKLDKILEKLDTYDKEMDERIDKALQQHVKMYHK